MKIFDCTTYHSEDLMLDVRFNILDEHVHKFIIIESEYSHSGQKKKLNFNIDNFKKFKNKIIYLPIRNEPEGIEKITNETDSFHKKRIIYTFFYEVIFYRFSKAWPTCARAKLIC